MRLPTLPTAPPTWFATSSSKMVSLLYTASDLYCAWARHFITCKESKRHSEIPTVGVVAEDLSKLKERKRRSDTQKVRQQELLKIFGGEGEGALGGTHLRESIPYPVWNQARDRHTERQRQKDKTGRPYHAFLRLRLLSTGTNILRVSITPGRRSRRPQKGKIQDHRVTVL